MQSRIFLWVFSVLTIALTAACTTSIPAPVVDRSVRPVTPPVVVTPISPANPNLPGNTAGSQFHVVQRGETLYGIARINNIDVNALSAWNNIVAGQTLRDGQVLRLTPPLGSAPALSSPGTVVTAIPAAGAIQGTPLPASGAVPPSSSAAPSLSPIVTPIVTPIEAPLKREPKSQRLPYSDAALANLQRGDAATSVLPEPRTVAPSSAASSPAVTATPTPSATAALPPPTQTQTQTATPTPVPPSAQASAVDIDIKPGSGFERDGIAWTWPTSGKVSSKFNDKAPMKGIDINANAGTAVVAAATGKVIYVGKEPRGYGQMVVINHAKETVSVYFHTDKVLVKEQQRVLLGQKIAEVADGAGNKMHFEVRRQGRPLDPVSMMPK